MKKAGLNATELQNAYSSKDNYEETYKEKFLLSFEVLVARTLLGGTEPLPTNLPTSLPDGSTPKADLNSVFERAISNSSTASDKEDFLAEACYYIDHTGLTKYDIENLYQNLKTYVMGEASLSAEENFYLKKNYEETILNKEESLLNLLKTVFPGQPILDFIVIDNSGGVDDLDIDGYLHSIIMTAKKEVEIGVINMFLKEKENELNYDGQVFAIYNDNSSVNQCALIVEGNEGLNNDGSLVVDTDSYFSIECKISDGKKNLECSDFDFDSEKFKGTDGTVYHAWFFNKDTQYFEVVFASKNIYNLQKLDIDVFSLGY